MAAFQAVDVPASFLFVGDLNGNHQEWVKQPRIIMAFQPLTLLLCLVAISWLLARPMHIVEQLT